MIILEKEYYIKEVNNQIEDKELQDNLIIIYDHLKGYKKISNIRKLIEKVLKEMFGTSYTDILIPYEFINSNIGTVVFSALFREDERVYTVKDLIELTKTKSNPKGFTPQHISQEIRKGNIYAIKKGNRWIFKEKEVNKYLLKKGIK